MKKVYIDRIKYNECASIHLNDAEIILAGTTVYSMPDNEYNDEYKRYAEEYDINFIFDSTDLEIDFYAVPQFDVFAIDSKGGYIGTIGETTYLESDYDIGYINKNRECFIIASSGKEFLENVSNWKENLKEYDGIKLYKSREDAQDKIEFIDIPQIDMELNKKFNL